MSEKRIENEKISRRDFLVKTGKAALAAAAVLGTGASKVLSAAEKKDEKTEKKKLGRLVRHVRNHPYKVGSKWICACGLSKNKPYCDGSHKRTEDEEPDKLYVYDEKNRIEIKPFY